MSVLFMVQEQVFDWDDMAEYGELAGPTMQA